MDDGFGGWFGRAVAGVALAGALVSAGAFPLSAASPAAPAGTGGAVASDEPRATAAGLEVLRAGGNAVDAAVATALALAVVFPEAGNLGGGGFAVVRLPAGSAGPAGLGTGPIVASLDFREEAPAAAHRTMYLDEQGEPIPDASLLGPLAAGVPGSPAGLHALHERFGSLPWARVVEPAERLAREGFAVDENLHERLLQARDLLARFPESAGTWLPGGEPPPVGAVMKLPALAATLRAYARRGPPAITRGPVAERVEEISRRHGGILTAGDLATYRPVWREPVRFEAFGWRVASMDLPSSGGPILAETFRVLERLGWAGAPRFGAERAHLLAETFRGAFADRYRMGDPSVTGVTAADVTSDGWLDRRVDSILSPDESADTGRRALDSRETPAFPGPPPELSGLAAGPSDTTHVSVVDGAGGAVALTTTLNGLFGSKVWVPGLGFLNNEMDDFAAAPGRPNLYGLVQGEANAVRPGKRMLSSMSPTIAWRPPAGATGGDRDAEVLVAGARGGSKIPTNTAQVLLHVMVDGDALQQAVDRPRLHHQWLPDRLQAEPDTFAPETRGVLERWGHALDVTEATAKVNAARALPDGTTEAASDPRGPTRGRGAGVAGGSCPAPGAVRGLPWTSSRPSFQ
ncbi:MAG: gamma-glutamyltransferase [Acidobacteriota bacterium]